MQSVNELPLQSIAHEERISVCPDCGNKELEFVNGELFCKKCGFLIE